MHTTFIQLYKYGTQVIYEGRYHTVDHITLSGYDIYVHLDGIQRSVISTALQCEYTEISLVRKE